MGDETLALIKPDAVIRYHVGIVLTEIELRGFNIAECKLVTRYQGQDGSLNALARNRFIVFYEEHKGKPFFDPLVDFMASGPFYALRLTKPLFPQADVVADWRTAMGSASLASREPGTIRYKHTRPGDPLYWNLVHGSDSAEAVERELNLAYRWGWLL